MLAKRNKRAWYSTLVLSMYPGSVKKCLRRNVLCKATGLYMRNDESWICFNASERCLDQEAAGLILQRLVTLRDSCGLFRSQVYFQATPKKAHVCSNML